MKTFRTGGFPDQHLCQSCISDHDNHRSICQIRNLMNLAHTGETQFSFENVDVAVIRKHLKNININKATGHDLLPPKLLKLGSHILCYPLCFILNILCASPLVCFQIFLNRPKYVLYLRKETL